MKVAQAVLYVYLNVKLHTGQVSFELFGSFYSNKECSSMTIYGMRSYKDTKSRVITLKRLSNPLNAAC